MTEDGAENPAISAPVADADMPPDLAQVVTAWPGLPAALKAGIVAMVKATKEVR